MSSIGASYAGVYVMQKRQKEKMERKEEEERATKSGEASHANHHDQNVKVGRTNKVFPGNFPGKDSAGK
ncbi:hypothetical protein FNV43_RR18469 [Rhamnella rubrinervis]|nr:hypothetical protein FNV43_RR18457 [Rhamnella rubrinervis]KAF3440188.1 hypothetical protein FNV43_RR18469 [Rhamnella rubrinervis]